MTEDQILFISAALVPIVYVMIRATIKFIFEKPKDE